MQPPSPFDWLATELSRLDQQQLRRGRRQVRSLGGGRCVVDGVEYWDFASNDYLDLATDPRLSAAAAEAQRDVGTGSRASALVAGWTAWQAQLEERLARFKRCAAALVFPSGYAANLGTICALVGPGDEVFCDRLNHASLVDGCRLSRARLRIYPHCDVTALRQDLIRKCTCRRRLIVTDSLFSMDGDFAPLVELAALAEEFGAMLLVDEAHATGVFGSRGGGLIEEAFDDAGRSRPTCLIGMGTLSKALGSQGGFVAGSPQVIDWLWNTSRTHMFSTALAPGSCAAALEALRIVEAEPDRRETLQQRSSMLREALVRDGWSIAGAARSPIVPILIGENEQTMKMAAQIRERGGLVAGIRPPTVPRGTARIRISLNSAHDEIAANALLKAVNDPATTTG